MSLHFPRPDSPHSEGSKYTLTSTFPVTALARGPSLVQRSGRILPGASCSGSVIPVFWRGIWLAVRGGAGGRIPSRSFPLFLLSFLLLSSGPGFPVLDHLSA